MTLDDFRFKVAVKQPLEFCHRGKVYNLTYGTDADGDFIAFGRLYDKPALFRSVGELLNDVKIENHFLREIILEL